MSEPDAKSAVVLELAEEFLERYRRGERPSLKEYADRHPDLAAEIHDVFPAMALMENIALRDESLAGPTGPEATMAALRLEQFGDYRIIREVGRGGMGIVYEAEQLSLGRHVALKVLPSHALLDPRQLQRFQREAKAVARLHHTNIVPVYGVGEHAGLHYYVMQFIQGLPLDEVLAELRRFRQAKRPSDVDETEADPPRPGDGTPDLSAATLAQSLVSGQFQAGAGAAELEGAAPLPLAWAGQRSAGVVTPTEAAPGGAEALQPGRSQTRGASPSRSLVSETSVHLPGQSRGSSLSESGRQYWQSVARVGVQVAEALAYAAGQGVLHRDIKPSNLLLDLQGTVWVTDFGLAKAATDTEDLTHTGDVIGTVRYLAPERFGGQTDIRGDVYSLGLTLYELLTLRPAFSDTDRNQLVKQVLQDEPPRPRKLNPAVPRDLETVVLKAIARDPAHRYQTPVEMAGDLKRFVEDRPVRARPVSEAEKLWRWCRRNPLPASLLAAVVLVFLAGFAGVSWQWRVAEIARKDEKNQRTRADLLRQGAETARDEADQARAASERSRAAAEAETYHAVLSEVRALRAGHEPGWREKALGGLARLAIMPTPRRDLVELRTEATATLGTPDIRLAARVALPGSDFGSFTFSPDGRTLVTADRKTGLDFWDVPGNRHLASVESLTVSEGAITQDKVVSLPDGRGFAMATGQGVVFTDAHGIRTTRAPIKQGSSKPTKLSLSANGQRLAVSWSDGAGTTVHDAASGALLGRFKNVGLTVASPDGKWLACLENSEIVLLPIPSGAPRIVLGRHVGVHALAFSPNGALLAAACADHTTVLWDVARREQLNTLRGHREKVFDAAFSPDGEWIATGGLDYTTRIWETRTGQNVATLPGLSSPTFGVKWAPKGDLLAVSLNNAREILLYKITGRHSVQQWLTGHSVELCCVAAHPRLDRLTTSGYAELSTWDLSVTRPSPVAIGPNPGAVTSLAYNSDGSLLAVGSGQILVRDGNTGNVQRRFSGPSPWVYGLAFDPAGGRLATGDQAGSVILWDLATTSRVQKFATGSTVWSVIFLDRPRGLVTHGRDAVLLYNLESGKLERKVDLAGGGIRKLVADREHSRLVVGFESGAIGSLSLPDLTPGLRLEHAHVGSVTCLALSPDGSLLATASDHRVVLRDARSFETLLRFPLWDGTLRDLTFDSTSRRLAMVGTGNEVDLWNLAALRDGLTALGLAWDRPAPAVVPASRPAPEGEQLRTAVPVIRRPGSVDRAAFDEAGRLVQSGVGAFESGRWAEAIRDLQQARDRLRTLHQFAPRAGQVASALAISLGFLGSALRNENRVAEAVASFKESGQVLEGIRHPTAVDLYNLACAYANLTTLVVPGSVPPTAAEREALANRAMDALRRSLLAGMNNFALMERDPDLDSLRERPDFRALIKEAKTGAKFDTVPPPKVENNRK
jgi:WD40 repeat protein/serine/threonine protein kinase